MHDKVLITEVRKRVSILEIKYEVLIKDLEVARGFLAMLERESMDDIVQQGPRTHAEIVGSAIADMLSRRPWMHRTDILNELLKRGVHVGNDQDSREQLASLSSIMSSDPRFAPVAGRLGCWKMPTLTDDIASESLGDSSDTPQCSGISTMRIPNKRKMYSIKTRLRRSRVSECQTPINLSVPWAAQSKRPCQPE